MKQYKSSILIYFYLCSLFFLYSGVLNSWQIKYLLCYTTESLSSVNKEFMSNRTHVIIGIISTIFFCQGLKLKEVQKVSYKSL